ncbi:uncharacterized protein LOC135340999 [Halichondria panicea]|uniref:uncharacterized protein LOC135340999 n=1 Tax=Halichondria panicea TaxID=6063 RepID=UPI00312BBB16
MSDYNEEEQNPDASTSADSPPAEGGQRPAGNMSTDTRYIRSLEGIVKLVSVPICVLGFILTIIGSAGFGGWYIFFGVSFIFYIAVVIVVETFIPNHYVHRLIDAVIMGIYGLLFGLTAIANLALSITTGFAIIGVGMIFSVACCGLCVAGTVFAIQTYRLNNGQGWAPSKPIIGPKGNIIARNEQ